MTYWRVSQIDKEHSSWDRENDSEHKPFLSSISASLSLLNLETKLPLCAQNPTLTAAYATAQVRGLQGEQPQGKWAYFNASKMVSLGKHYAAYGAALGGLNGAPAELSERRRSTCWQRTLRKDLIARRKSISLAASTKA